MSIIALALRVSATRALLTEGATLAGARVYDSAILPLDEIASADPKPFIVVSTEDDTTRASGSDLMTGDRDIQLVIETALSHSVTLPNGEDGGEVMIPPTDAGLELTLGILSRQIASCLYGRGGGAWGDVFRRLTGSIVEAVSRRGVQSKEGARLAARQTVYTVRALAEPAYGEPLPAGTALARFLEVAAADEETAPLAAVLREAIEGAPIGWPAVYHAASMIAGYTDEQGRAIGIAPLAPALGEDDTEVALEATITPDGGEHAPWVEDEESIDEKLPPDDDGAG